jgi:hypothetical protein
MLKQELQKMVVELPTIFKKTLGPLEYASFQ